MIVITPSNSSPFIEFFSKGLKSDFAPSDRAAAITSLVIATIGAISMVASLTSLAIAIIVFLPGAAIIASGAILAVSTATFISSLIAKHVINRGISPISIESNTETDSTRSRSGSYEKPLYVEENALMEEGITEDRFMLIMYVQRLYNNNENALWQQERHDIALQREHQSRDLEEFQKLTYEEMSEIFEEDYRKTMAPKPAPIAPNDSYCGNIEELLEQEIELENYEVLYKRKQLLESTLSKSDPRQETLKQYHNKLQNTIAKLIHNEYKDFM